MSEYKLGNPLVLNLQPCIRDVDGNLMIVGEKYEMYSPIAKLALDGIGMTFNNDDCSFVYTGEFAGKVCTDDITYKGTAMAGHDILSKALGTEILCPDFIANKYIRPATDG